MSGSDSGRRTAPVSRRSSFGGRAARELLVVALCFGAAAPPSATAQEQAPPAAGSAKPYTLSVTSENGFIGVALTAERAKWSEVATALAARLRAEVKVGATLAAETLTAGFRESPLEVALASVAPRVLIDYELRQGAPPRPLVIHLLAAEDPDPPSTAVPRGASEGVLIEGHTEEPADSEPLKVSGDKHLLTIAATKQPLSLVAMAIGDVLGVPVDLQYAASDLVDAELTNAPAEEAVVGLSAKVRLVVRVDVTRADRTPLRLVVVPQAPEQ